MAGRPLSSIHPRDDPDDAAWVAVQAARRSARPVGIAVRRTSTDAPPDGLEFGVDFWAIDLVGPVERFGKRPLSQPRRTLTRHAPLEATPDPVFRTIDQPRPQCITLHVPCHCVEMAVRLDRKRLETALIQMSVAHGSFGPLPALGVSVGHPLHESRQVAVTSRPKQEVPVVGHPTERADANRRQAYAYLDNPLEGGVVLVLIEDLHPAHAPIQDVEDHTSRRYSCSSRHAQILSMFAIPANICACPLFQLRVRFLKRLMRSRVIGPGVPSPMVRLSTLTTGTTSAAVPARKHSSAM